MKRIILLILSALLIFLALVPRSVELLTGNFLFGIDQGRDYLAVKNIVVDHKLTLIGSEIGGGFAGFQGIFHGPFHYYFLSIFFILFNGNPYGGMVLMFAYSLLTIILGFYLGKKIFGVRGGLVAALLMAVSPPLISQSRFIWNTHGAPVFILLAFYFLYRFMETDNKQPKFIFLAAFFSGFIYNFQLGIALPLCLALFLFRNQYAAIFSGLILGFLPMIFFELRHGLVLKGALNYFNAGETNVSLKFVELILKSHLGTFIYTFSDTFPRQKLISGELLLVLFAGLFFFFLLKEKNQHLRQFFIYLSLIPFLSFFVFSFLRGPIYPYYLMSLNLVYIFLFVYVLYSVYSYENLFGRLILTGFFIFLLANGCLNAIRVFRSDYADDGGVFKIKGKMDALDYIYKDAENEKFGLLVFNPGVYPYSYDYLIWWYGQKEYHYLPHQKKEGLFYLLIEKDPGKPWTYKGWLETVVKTGRVLKEEELPSGFIIQKRYEEN